MVGRRRRALLEDRVAATALSAGDPAPALAEALRVVLAATAPHVLVVGWLDRRAATVGPR